MISRNTKQKAIIQKEIGEHNSFFTAEELHQRVQKQSPAIGIATVYRYLKEAQKNGAVHTYTCNRRIIYSTKKNSHCHFTCEKCGKTEHVDITSLDFIKNKIGGSICHFQVDITGTCEVCKT